MVPMRQRAHQWDDRRAEGDKWRDIGVSMPGAELEHLATPDLTWVWSASDVDASTALYSSRGWGTSRE